MLFYGMSGIVTFNGTDRSLAWHMNVHSVQLEFGRHTEQPDFFSLACWTASVYLLLNVKF